MAKKYTWVVVGLMVTTMIIVLVGKIFTREDNSLNENTKEEVTQKGEDKAIAKPEDNSNNIPKGKLPAGSTPPANASLIEGVTWVWQKTVMGDGKTVVPKKEGVFTLLLKKDGNVSLKTDCNGGFGEYKIGSDGVISFGPLSSTMMYCEGSQESIYTNAISTSSRYMLDPSGNLVLLLQYDSGSVFFKKQ